MKKNKPNPDTFIAAIDLLPCEKFSCHALSRAAGDARFFESTSPETQLYEAMFQSRKYDRGFWVREHGPVSPEDAREAETRRIVALQLAACLAKDGFTAEDFS